MKAESKQKKQKIRVSGQRFMHARTSLRTQTRLCVRSFLPRNPKNNKNRAEPQNGNSNNLTCFPNTQTYKPKLDKQEKWKD